METLKIYNYLILSFFFANSKKIKDSLSQFERHHKFFFVYLLIFLRNPNSMIFSMKSKFVFDHCN